MSNNGKDKSFYYCELEYSEGDDGFMVGLAELFKDFNDVNLFN